MIQGRGDTQCSVSHDVAARCLPLLLFCVPAVVHQHHDSLALLLAQFHSSCLLAAAGVAHHVRILNKGKQDVPQAFVPGDAIKLAGLAADGEEQRAGAAVAHLQAQATAQNSWRQIKCTCTSAQGFLR